MEQKREDESSEETESDQSVLTNEKDIAMDFAVQVNKKFDRLIKATVLFGSQAKEATATVESDIDIIIIVDDASVNWDIELIAWYREELAKIISSSKYAKELHVNTIKLTTWWQDLLYGEPVVINIIRYGEVLIDIGGFFNPLKALLLQGKIRSTPEAVYAALQRAPSHLARSKAAQLGAIEGVYWTMIDSAQAGLITAGKMPPSPEHIPLMMKQTFVDKGMLSMEDVKNLKDIYLLHKGIVHNQITNIKGSDIDAWQNRAEKFLQEMTSLIAKMIEAR
jgi:predicted nucleotidyltransferase